VITEKLVVKYLNNLVFTARCYASVTGPCNELGQSPCATEHDEP